MTCGKMQGDACRDVFRCRNIFPPRCRGWGGIYHTGIYHTGLTLRPDLPSLLPLVCPACRVRVPDGRSMHTLALETVLASTAEAVETGVLRCVNPPCGRRYPVIAGIPIIFTDMAAFLSTRVVEVVERDLPVEAATLLAEAGPDHAPYARLLEILSMYLDAHWGDHAAPPPDGPAPEKCGFAALADHVAARASTPRPRAVELGTSVGRGLAELARGAELAVGIDQSFAALRRAAQLFAGRPVRYARRVMGRHYTEAVVEPARATNVALVCSDALDPPLVPRTFDRVSALNLLDEVHSPPQLLSVADGLLRPGGELLLASPFAWQSCNVDEGQRIGDLDPAEAVARRLADGTDLEAPYTLHEQMDLTWWLRRDARSAAVYRTHYLRATKA